MIAAVDYQIWLNPATRDETLHWKAASNSGEAARVANAPRWGQKKCGIKEGKRKMVAIETADCACKTPMSIMLEK